MLTGALLAGSHAAEINWTANAITGNATDVITEGTLVEAVNGTGDGVSSSPTINGVTFRSESSLLGESYKGDVWASTVADTGYDQLLSTIDFDASGTEPLTVKTFTGLMPGKKYLIQYWYADSDNRERTLTFKGPGQHTINSHSYGVGIFYADSTSQDLVVTASQNGPRLTGYQLRVIPESTALGLVMH